MNIQAKLQKSPEPIDNVLNPISNANGMPNEFYTDQEYFEFERDNIFANTWVCVDFTSELLNNSNVKPIDFMGLPLVLIRNTQNELKVFHNVCSHRGMKLVSEESFVQGMIRCPYHSWTYDLNGNLKGTPHIGGIGKHRDDRFDCKKNGLKEISSSSWMGMLFINLSGDAKSFEDHINPLEERWREFLGKDGLNELYKVGNENDIKLDVNCNWKLAVENYCESYHLPWVHPSLNKYSRLEDHYNIMFSEYFAGQGTTVYNLASVAGTHLPAFSNWPENKSQYAEYVAIFPNVLLGIQKDHAFAIVIEPVSAEKSIEHLSIFYIGEKAASDEYSNCRASVVESWRIVFGEDIPAVEGMQKGRHSPGFKGGVFSPEMDVPTHYFQKWLALQVKKSLEKNK